VLLVSTFCAPRVCRKKIYEFEVGREAATGANVHAFLMEGKAKSHKNFFKQVEAKYLDPQIKAQRAAAKSQGQQQLNYIDVDFNAPPPPKEGAAAASKDNSGTTCFCLPKKGKGNKGKGSKGSKGKTQQNPYNSQQAYAEIAIQEQKR